LPLHRTALLPLFPIHGLLTCSYLLPSCAFRLSSVATHICLARSRKKYREEVVQLAKSVTA